VLERSRAEPRMASTKLAVSGPAAGAGPQHPLYSGPLRRSDSGQACEHWIPPCDRPPPPQGRGPWKTALAALPACKMIDVWLNSPGGGGLQDPMAQPRGLLLRCDLPLKVARPRVHTTASTGQSLFSTPRGVGTSRAFRTGMAPIHAAVGRRAVCVSPPGNPIRCRPSVATASGWSHGLHVCRCANAGASLLGRHRPAAFTNISLFQLAARQAGGFA